MEVSVKQAEQPSCNRYVAIAYNPKQSKAYILNY